MDPVDTLRLALNSVIHRRMRSWLTVLGIVIGVAAVVSLVSLGQGFETVITDELAFLGTDTLGVVPGAPTATGEPEGNPFDAPAHAALGFTTTEFRIVDSHPDIALADGIVSGRSEVTYRGTTSIMNVKGVDPNAWSQLETRDLLQGRMLVGGDARSAVVTTAVVDAYRDPPGLNQIIDVDGRSLRIVGIIDGEGFFGMPDRSVYVVKDTARQILDFPADRVSEIDARLVDGADPARVADELTARLLAHRHLAPDEQDFTIFTGEAVQRQVAQILGAFTAFLGGIAAIALLVGGIGIANTMFMAVMERSKQIGILKALGVTRRGIASIFLAESSLLGLVGGMLGVFLGWIVAFILSEYGTLALGPPGTPPPELTVTWELALGAMLFSLVLGSIFGLLPALRAARLAPVDTLRSA
jgi:putative ABC transport system permease protein